MHQDHKTGLITFRFGSEDKDTDKDKDKVKITDVRESIKDILFREQIKIIESPNKFRDQVRIAKNVDKFYTQASVLSSELLKQIEEDQGNKFLDTVWATVFTYDVRTESQTAEGGVKFSVLYSTNAASENAEDGTEED